MTETRPLPPTGPTASTEQADAILAWAEAIGQQRKLNFRADFNECDFVAGAAAALYALGREDRMPPMWVLGPLSGRPVFGPEPWREEEEIDGDEDAE